MITEIFSFCETFIRFSMTQVDLLFMTADSSTQIIDSFDCHFFKAIFACHAMSMEGGLATAT